MSLLSWISENLDATIAIVGTVGGWLGWKRAERATERQRAQLTAALRAEVYRVLMQPSEYQRVRDRLVKALADAARRANIPSKIADAIGETLVDEALALFYEKVIEKQLTEIHARAEKVASKLSEVAL